MSTVANKASLVHIEFISASIKISLPKSRVKMSCQLRWNDPLASLLTSENAKNDRKSDIELTRPNFNPNPNANPSFTANSNRICS